MTKVLKFALKIKGGGREGGTCKSSDPATPQNLKRAHVLDSKKAGLFRVK